MNHHLFARGGGACGSLICALLLLLPTGIALAVAGSGVSSPDTLDSKPPIVSIAYPGGGEIFNGADPETLSWTIAEDSWDGGTPVLLAVFDTGGQIWTDSVAADETGVYTYVWTVTDQNVADARLRIAAADRFGWAASDTSGYFNIKDSATGIGTPQPLVDRLGPIYPNPFNPSTRVSFSLTAPAIIELGVYDTRGRKVALIADGEWQPGSHEVTWNGRNSSGRNMPSGMYLARLQIRGENRSSNHIYRMTLVK